MVRATSMWAATLFAAAAFLLACYTMPATASETVQITITKVTGSWTDNNKRSCSFSGAVDNDTRFHIQKITFTILGANFTIRNMRARAEELVDQVIWGNTDDNGGSCRAFAEKLTALNDKKPDIGQCDMPGVAEGDCLDMVRPISVGHGLMAMASAVDLQFGHAALAQHARAAAAFDSAPIMEVRQGTHITEHAYYTSVAEAASDQSFFVPTGTLVKVLKKNTDIPYDNANIVNDCNRFNPLQTDQRSSCSLLVIVVTADGSPQKNADGAILEGYTRAGALQAWSPGN